MGKAGEEEEKKEDEKKRKQPTTVSKVHICLNFCGEQCFDSQNITHAVSQCWAFYGR